MWRILCCNLWPSTKQLNAQGINNIFGNHKKYFRHRLFDTQSPRTPPTIQPLPQPDLNPTDLCITVDIVTNNGRVGASSTLGGERMKKLIEEGTVSYYFSEPYVLGNAKCFFDSRGCSCSRHCLHTVKEGEEGVMLYNPQVMLINSKDSSTCKLFSDPLDCEWGSLLECKPTGDTAYDWQNSQMGWLNFAGEDGLTSGKKGLPLQPTQQAAEIVSRLKKKPIFCSVSVAFDVLEPGDKVAITAYSLELMVDRKTMNKKFQTSKGVTVSNVLDQLERVVITSNGPMRLSSAAGNNTSTSNTMEEDSESSDDDDARDLSSSDDDDEDAGNLFD